MPPRIPSTDARRLVSLDKAATYIDASPRTARRMITSGEITGYRIGKRLLRVDLNEVDRATRPVPSAREAS